MLRQVNALDLLGVLPRCLPHVVLEALHGDPQRIWLDVLGHGNVSRSWRAGGIVGP